LSRVTRRFISLILPIGLTIVILLISLIRTPISSARSEVEFRLPMRGNVSVVGFLPGEGDHGKDTRDYWAVDFSSDDSTVYPTGPGKVAYASYNCGKAGYPPGTPCEQIPPPYYGNIVAIDHGSGIYSIYAHLAKEGLPKVGDSVSYDTKIGTMSDSGCPINLCGPFHLHFAIRQGDPNLSGEGPLWGANTPINAWEKIKGLPNPPATGKITASPTQSSLGQLKFNTVSPFGWWLTVYTCGNGSIPVRLDGKTIFDREPNSVSLQVGGGDHLLEWSDNVVSVNFVWWPLSPPQCPVVSPVLQASSTLRDSIAAMRAQNRIEAQAQGDVAFQSGSGHIMLTMPDGVEGQWDGLGYSVRTNPTPSGTAVIANGKQSGYLATKGAATTVLDSILSLPGYASGWEVQQEGNAYRLEGVLTPDAVKTITTKMISFEIPGNPDGRIFIFIDSSNKTWQRLELKLTWALARFNIFGRDVGAGPTGTVALAFKIAQ
jgi:hypothetical protein